MSSESTAKKNVQKLQRAIVEGLEDVKGQDIQVFNTEGLSPLFERVIVASGTSNRQTKALAASVRDAVREAGYDKPRVEGEDNGEWIIVDCGPAVVHVMQPSIRQYYRLEDIWGGKPVRLKRSAPPVAAARTVAPAGPSARATADDEPAPPPRRRSRSSTGVAADGAAARPRRRSTTSRDAAPATAVKVVKVGAPATRKATTGGRRSAPKA